MKCTPEESQIKTQRWRSHTASGVAKMRGKMLEHSIMRHMARSLKAHRTISSLNPREQAL